MPTSNQISRGVISTVYALPATNFLQFFECAEYFIQKFLIFSLSITAARLRVKMSKSKGSTKNYFFCMKNRIKI